MSSLLSLSSASALSGYRRSPGVIVRGMTLHAKSIGFKPKLFETAYHLKLPLATRHQVKHLKNRTFTPPEHPSPFSQNRSFNSLLVLTMLIAGFIFTQEETQAEESNFSHPPTPLSEAELHLLASALNVVSQDRDNATVMKDCFQRLFDDCINDNWDAVQAYPDLAARITDTTGKTLFLRMVEEGREKQIDHFFLLGIKYNYGDPQGNNGLHLAAMNGYASLIPILSDKFGINDKNEFGKTPLHLSIEKGHSQVVGTLLKNGAAENIFWQSPEGIAYSPLALAIQSGDILTVDRILKKNPIRLKESLPQIGTVLHLAIITRKSAKCPILEHLLIKYNKLSKGLLLIPDEKGRIPFHLAAYEGVVPAIQFLVKDHGVSVNVTDKQGRTAVHWAVMGEKPDVIKRLYWLDADLRKPDDEELTPMALIKKEERSLAADECRNLLTKLPTISRLAREEPHDYTQRPPYNLVFQGGGGKGIAYVGIARVLERIEWLPQVKRLAGTSAGSIAAAFLAVGYNSKELEETLGKDFSEFLDPIDALSEGILKSIDQGNKRHAVWATLQEYWRSSGINPFAKATALQNRLLETTGLCKGDALQEWVSRVVEEGTNIPNCTFKELHELVLKNPKKYKDLYVYALCLQENKTPELIRLSHEHPVFRDVVIADAVRASASIPGVFRPHILQVKPPHDQKHARPDLGRFVDGGLIKNFPIDAFDENKYQNEPDERGCKTNYRTLGFKFDTPDETVFELNKTMGLGQAIIAAFYNSEEILLAQTAQQEDRVVKIPIEPTGIQEFSFTTAKKQRSIESAENAFGFFLTPPQEN